MKIKIEAGNLYDPKNQKWGEPGDLYLEDDRVVEYFPRPDLVIDAHGKAVMPGAIEVHCHVAAFGMNFLRVRRLHPTPEEIGRFYAQMGFTHVNEALMTVTTAAFVHHELRNIPIVDTSALLVLPLRELASLIREEQASQAAAAVRYFVCATKAMGIKLFEPELRYPQEIYAHRNISAEAVVNFFSQVAEDCNSRLVVHTSPKLLSIDFARPQSLWFTHLGSGLVGESETEQARKLLEAGAGGDMGLCHPGRRIHLSLEPDGAAEAILQVELGFSRPLVFFHLDPVHEDLSARALHLALEAGKSSLAFSLDCATPAWPLAFTALFSQLLQGDQEPGYSLGELVAATRQLPAEFLGLVEKGHLGPGAQADVAIYEVNDDMAPNEMAERLRRCQVLIKSGALVIADYKWTGEEPAKQTYWRELEVPDLEMGRRLLDESTFRAESLEIGKTLAGDLKAVRV
ncbi:MAG: amidohydrolase family protein [Syntrophobacteria bacterium]